MFDSLDAQIKHDDDVTVSRKEKVVKATMMVVVAVLLFAVLIFAVRALG